MVGEKTIRLSQAAKELNVSTSKITEHLTAQGMKEINVNSKITISQLEAIAKDWGIEVILDKIGDAKLAIPTPVEESVPETVQVVTKTEEVIPEVKEVVIEPVVLKEKEVIKVSKVEEQEEDTNKTDSSDKVPGLKILGKIDLNANKKKKETVNVKKKEGKVLKSTPLQEETVKSKDKPVVLKKKQDVPRLETVSEKIVEIVAPIEQPIQEFPVQNEQAVSVEDSQSDQEDLTIKAKAQTLNGLTVLGKMDLNSFNKQPKPIASSDDRVKKLKKRRIRDQKIPFDQKNRPVQDEKSKVIVINKANQNTQNNQNNNSQNNQVTRPENKSNNNSTQTPLQNRSSFKKPLQGGNNNSNNNNTNNNTNNNSNNNSNNNNSRNSSNNNNNNRKHNDKKHNEKPTNTDIGNSMKATLARMQGLNTNASKKKSFKKDKANRNREQEANELEDLKILKVTEFISANELANLMSISVNEVISTCLTMGLFVSINQRLDAESIEFIANEFGFEVSFTSVGDETTEEEEIEDTENLEMRAPIVTIMGHVDHGKTSLLDYIRDANVTSQESGGITQHIGAYDVMTKDGKKIVFLDTPGHEAFTAMRARGAKVTDIVVIVVAADDGVMPQTREAINHAKLANVPTVIAINKIDKPSANSNRIREELANENILVESWGGKYQEQEISAKTGLGIPELLEKILLEAELLDLKANPNKKANGTVIEAMLDKGKGYVTTILVQSGTLRVGDIILVGSHYGRVKAMNDHRGKSLKIALPSTPIQVLGLSGAPQAGDTIRVLETEREAREIATKREQIMREQTLRSRSGFSLEGFFSRKALGEVQELKIIVKGDVDGSVEALTDSLLKLTNQEVEVIIIHKAVGQISEADINLAIASEAFVIGFQVRPSVNARKLAEQSKIQIKLYSIIYDAIADVKSAMDGMLAPKVEEEIVGNIEVREIFKISKIGTVAGCYVLDGYIKRANAIRVIRDGIVIYEGELTALKRFKDDVQEVKSGFECGLSIRNFNDLKTGDLIESYERKETKRSLF